jgi:phosphatidylglycerophosphate synthase
MLLSIAPALGLLLMPLAFWLMVGYGPVGLALVWLFVFPVVCLLSWRPFLRAIGVTFRHLYEASWRSLAISTAMACSIMTMRQVMPASVDPLPCLIALSLLGSGVYMGISYVIVPEQIREIKILLRGRTT